MVEIDELAARLDAYNQAYRKGEPLVDDDTYVRHVEQLRQRDPQHPFLHHVEPETFSGRQEIRHPMPMLSTEKAYTSVQLERFVARIEKEARLLGIDPVRFQATPKLDGLAGRDDGQVLASRGNGIVGFDITSAFAKGVQPVGGRGQGLGEIVAVMSYFEEHLADKFEHPRNMVVGIISSDTINEDARKALADGVVRFVPYNQLPCWRGDGQQLLEGIDTISEELTEGTDYPMDGVVVEVLDEQLKAHMGATAHHYRWQIAVKRKGQTAETTVKEIHWQVGRTGNVTPVMEVAPVTLSGATLRRVTAHNAGTVVKLSIGPGARIEIIRSGEVIPKLEKVLQGVDNIQVPAECPACGLALKWEKDFLKCAHLRCPAQTEQRISHWFRTLGNADWFGIKTIRKLVAADYDSLEKIYAMSESDFMELGFGPVQSRNLAAALTTSRTKAVEDWRFLAALGIPNLGIGDSRKLLQQHALISLPDLQAQQIAQINGFGEVTSQSIVQGLAELKTTFLHLLELGFNLEISEPLDTRNTGSPIAGKNIVFSGKMKEGGREQMQLEARQLGANVQSAVNSKTDFLVCGEKVGQSKLNKAAQLEVQTLSEEDYYRLLNR